jgi:tRNA (guanosine-2'-O-)-methyltransferase
MKSLRPTDLKRLHRSWRRRTDGRIAVLLDDVQTPYNVGAIVRTAAAFQIEHLWLSGVTALPHHPKAAKTALGTDRYVPWTHVPAALDALSALRNDGFVIVGIELASTAVPITDALLGDPVCLVFGHEDHGLRPALLQACDEVAFIPTPGKVGSLNVATAAAIALYEVRRREWMTPGAVASSDAERVDLDS